MPCASAFTDGVWGHVHVCFGFWVEILFGLYCWGGGDVYLDSIMKFVLEINIFKYTGCKWTLKIIIISKNTFVSFNKKFCFSKFC